MCKIQNSTERERERQKFRKRERERLRERGRERERQRKKTFRRFQRNTSYNREESVNFSKCVSDSVVSSFL